MDRTRQFKNGDVVVDIPDQKSMASVDVKEVPMPAIKDTHSVLIGFQPFRMVVGLEFFDPTNANAVVEKFDPPIKISIRYTNEDKTYADNVCRDLRLGFWDGTRWTRFTASKHEFRLEPDETSDSGGWGRVNVKNWIDPAKAWGT
jgi:hypothetical protein